MSPWFSKELAEFSAFLLRRQYAFYLRYFSTKLRLKESQISCQLCCGKRKISSLMCSLFSINQLINLFILYADICLLSSKSSLPELCPHLLFSPLRREGHPVYYPILAHQCSTELDSSSSTEAKQCSPVRGMVSTDRFQIPVQSLVQLLGKSHPSILTKLYICYIYAGRLSLGHDHPLVSG